MFVWLYIQDSDKGELELEKPGIFHLIFFKSVILGSYGHY